MNRGSRKYEYRDRLQRFENSGAEETLLLKGILTFNAKHSAKWWQRKY
jgi:hypothetical protein